MQQEDEVAVWTRELIKKEDPPNAHQAHHRLKSRFDECVASVFQIYSDAVVLTFITLSAPVKVHRKSRLVQCRRRRLS